MGLGNSTSLPFLGDCPVPSCYRAFSRNVARHRRQVTPEKGVSMTHTKLVKGVLYKKVYSHYIRKDGRKIFPKNAKAFCFWVKA